MMKPSGSEFSSLFFVLVMDYQITFGTLLGAIKIPYIETGLGGRYAEGHQSFRGIFDDWIVSGH